MDDNLWGNLDPVTGAASKRPSIADAPTRQPMKAGIKPAQQKAPSGDQKKHRRQMNKKADQTSSTTPTKESTMTAQPTEAELLQRLAAATTLTEQAALSARLDALR